MKLDKDHVILQDAMVIRGTTVLGFKKGDIIEKGRELEDSVVQSLHDSKSIEELKPQHHTHKKESGGE